MSTDKSPRFELVVQVRDKLGKPTGKTKTISTDSPEELDGFYERYNVASKKKRKKKAQKSSNNVRNKTLKSLAKLQTLQLDWDGNNAPPINTILLEKAAAFIQSVSDIMRFQPKIIALAETEMEHKTGGIRIFFQNYSTHKELEVDFVHPEYIKYNFHDPIEKTSLDSAVPTNKSNEIRKLVIKVFN